jgi:UDP-N-acetyl-D-mannosaminuronate dehydrogenase
VSRLAHMLAIEGLGYEDIAVRCGISKNQAKAVVWDIERKRVRKLAAKLARLHNAAVKNEQLRIRVVSIFEKVS